MSEDEAMRYTFRSVGNDLSLEGNQMTANALLNLARTLDSITLARLAQTFKEITDEAP
jgi:hypothetical protein